MTSPGRNRQVPGAAAVETRRYMLPVGGLLACCRAERRSFSAVGAMNDPGRGPAADWGVGRYERTAQMLLPAARVLVDAAAVVAGERVLDLGSGTGNAALLAAAVGAQVTAVDPSPRLLGVAATTAEQQGLFIVSVVGEAANVPAPDRSFDCVLSNFGVIFAPRADAAVAEMARVLEDRGRAVFTAWLPGGAVGALADAAQDLVRSAMGAGPAPPGFAWHDESAVSELFSRHDMRVAVAGRHELTFTAPSPGDYLDAERDSHPMAVAGFQLLHRLGQGEQAREQLLQVLVDHNEDADAFRSTSQYVVVVARAG
jgi:SAM-dependent methyltransferase